MSSTEKRRPGRPATGLTPVQGVRVPEDRWRKLAESAGKAGTDRSKVVNQFAAWYTREKGAKLPERPPADES